MTRPPAPMAALFPDIPSRRGSRHGGLPGSGRYRRGTAGRGYGTKPSRDAARKDPRPAPSSGPGTSARHACCIPIAGRHEPRTEHGLPWDLVAHAHRRPRHRYRPAGDLSHHPPARRGRLRRGLSRRPHPTAGALRRQAAPPQPGAGQRRAVALSPGSGDHLVAAPPAHRAGVRLQRDRQRRAVPGDGAAGGEAAVGARPGGGRARPDRRRPTSSNRSPARCTRRTRAGSSTAISSPKMSCCLAAPASRTSSR